MCRKNYLHGCCLCALGFGLIVGHCLESWLMSCVGGFGLMVFGVCFLRKK